MDTPSPTTLGQLIKEYRTAHKMSLAAFSERCGLSRSYLTILEANRRPDTKEPPSPSLQVILVAAAAMEMDVNDVLLRMGLPVRDKQQEMAQSVIAPLSTAEAFLAPFQHIPITQESLISAIREGRVLILPFRAPRLNDMVYVPVKQFDMAVAHVITEVEGGIYTASSESAGSIRFSLFDIGHSVFTSIAEANKARDRWWHSH